MARKVRYSGLETRTARLKLAVRRKPYPGPSLGRGIKLNYRRCKGNGSWVLKARDGHGKYWERVISQADDHDEADGKTVQTFFEAQDTAKQLARGGGETDITAPITVDTRARRLPARPDLARCARLQRRPPARASDRGAVVQADRAAHVARTARMEDGLLGTLAPASINRLCNSVLRGARARGAARSAHHEPERGKSASPCCRTRRRAQRGDKRREGARACRRRLCDTIRRSACSSIRWR